MNGHNAHIQRKTLSTIKSSAGAESRDELEKTKFEILTFDNIQHYRINEANVTSGSDVFRPQDIIDFENNEDEDQTLAKLHHIINKREDPSYDIDGNVQTEIVVRE